MNKEDDDCFTVNKRRACKFIAKAVIEVSESSTTMIPEDSAQEIIMIIVPISTTKKRIAAIGEKTSTTMTSASSNEESDHNLSMACYELENSSHNEIDQLSHQQKNPGTKEVTIVEQQENDQAEKEHETRTLALESIAEKSKDENCTIFHIYY